MVLRSPQDTLYALVSDWPIEGGVHQQRAIDFCRAWVAGRMPGDGAAGDHSGGGGGWRGDQ
ncbi:DUF982 domain-containing protein [Rhizobium leguminosarum]|uniref:DUF982 domain-containing protein n=1 Tax=Rhizobium leguminosarum TaxID=384 RepID=UPI001DFA2A54|nr:DUF982 domain-containing protein [Rhizobium leguminosarum]MBP2445336.1 hypothetical protein [Rhizobium leguminosarum]